MKKYLEYIILGLVALACILYIGLRDSSDINYDLPSFRLISRDDFTKLEISGAPSGVLEFVKGDDGWSLTEGNYPADGGKINKLLDAVEEVVPVDLVSQAGSHGRYDLDEENKITLKAWNGERLVREIYYGKLSSSNNYNYVLFPGDKNVYTLRGNLRNTLESSADDFRDKTVLALNRNDIIRISYSDPAEGMSRTIIKGTGDAWTDETGEVFDSEKVSSLLGNLSNLRAVRFLDTTPDGNGITLKMTTSTENSLVLYPATQEGYPALSSGHPHPFILTTYTGDALLEAFAPEEPVTGEGEPVLDMMSGPLPGLGGGA